MIGIFIQILMYAIIALIGLFLFKQPMLAASLIIFLFTIYSSTSLFMSPAWASWMKDLTEKIPIGRYFGVRNKIFGIVSIITIILAGILLSYFKKINAVFVGFAILFTIAAISRFISRQYLKKQHEPKLKLNRGYYFSFWQFIKKAPSNNYGKFAIFMALLTFAVNISGPFFAPYLLKDLGLSYFTFTLIHLVVSSVATLLTMPFWGKFVDKYGCVRTMSATIWTIPFIPVMWLISPSVYWLVFVQIISGIVWAGFNIASGAFTYAAVTKERMNLCIAYTSILNGVAVFVGALLGGVIASMHITFMNIFLFVFLVSGILRMIIVIIFFNSIKEVKQVKHPQPFYKAVLRPLKEVIMYPFDLINHNNHGSQKR
jgi:MFS family permease